MNFPEFQHLAPLDHMRYKTIAIAPLMSLPLCRSPVALSSCSEPSPCDLPFDKTTQHKMLSFSFTSKKPLDNIAYALPHLDQDEGKARSFHADEVAKAAIKTMSSSPVPMAVPSESWLPKTIMLPLLAALRFFSRINRFIVTNTTTALPGENAYLIIKGPFPKRQPNDPVDKGMQYYDDASAVACVKAVFDQVFPTDIAPAIIYQAFSSRNRWFFSRGKALMNIKVGTSRCLAPASHVVTSTLHLPPMLPFLTLQCCHLLLTSTYDLTSPQVRATLPKDCKPHHVAMALATMQRKGGPGAHFTIDTEGKASRPASLNVDIPGVHIEDKDKPSLNTKVAVRLRDTQRGNPKGATLERYQPHSMCSHCPPTTYSPPPSLTQVALPPPRRVLDSLRTFGSAYIIQETWKNYLESNGFSASGELSNLVKGLGSSPDASTISDLTSKWTTAHQIFLTAAAAARALDMELSASIKPPSGDAMDTGPGAPRDAETVSLALDAAIIEKDRLRAVQLEILHQLVNAATKALLDHPDLIHPPLEWYEIIMATDPLLNILNFIQIKEDKFSFTFTFDSEATKNLFDSALPLTIIHPSFSLNLASIKIIPEANLYRICIRITSGSVRDNVYLRAIITSLSKILTSSDTSLVQRAISGIKKSNRSASLNDTVGRGELFLVNNLTGETVAASKLSEEDLLTVWSGKHGKPLSAMFREKYDDMYLALHLGSKASLATCAAHYYIPFDVINPKNMQPWGTKVMIMPYEALHSSSIATPPAEFNPFDLESNNSKICMMTALKHSYSILTDKSPADAMKELNSISQNQPKPFISMTKTVGILLVTFKDSLITPPSDRTNEASGLWSNVADDDDWGTYMPVSSPTAAARPPPSPSTAEKERALMAALESDLIEPPPPRTAAIGSKKPLPQKVILHPPQYLPPKPHYLILTPAPYYPLNYATHTHASRPRHLALLSPPRPAAASALQPAPRTTGHDAAAPHGKCCPQDHKRPRRRQRNRRRRQHAKPMAARFARDIIRTKILNMLKYRRWGRIHHIKLQLHRLTHRFLMSFFCHRTSKPAMLCINHSCAPHPLPPNQKAPTRFKHSHISTVLAPIYTTPGHAATTDSPPHERAHQVSRSTASHQANRPCSSLASTAVEAVGSQPQPQLPATATATRGESRISNLLCTGSALVETSSNTFHTPVATGVARQNARNGHPASIGTHPATQQAPQTDPLHRLTVSLTPHEESSTVTVKISASITHALNNLLLEGSRAQGGTNTGGGARLLGGAGCMYSASETREMDKALVTHGLWADWGYQWIEGDCGFDSLSSLSGVPSSTIRNGAMDILSTRLANISEDTTDIKGFMEEMISEHKERGGCEDLNDANYITSMRKGARSGGLWMDNLVAGLAGEALKANIEIYEYADGSITPQGGSARNPQWPMYCLLYTRGPPGHFTPLSRLPAPAQTTTHPRTQLSHAYPEHRAPDSAVQHHRLPQAIRPFWEKQDRRFCWLHAFNMARKACLDQDSITPSDIIQWFTTEQQSPRYEHHRTILNDTNLNSRPFDPLSGNFNQHSFAFWAFLTQLARISHVPMPPRPSHELNVDSLIPFLTRTLTDLQQNNESTLPAFILATQEQAGYGHATTLLYEDSSWFWLDSDPTKQYRAILTGPAAEPNRRELLTVARCLYAIDHGAHGLHECPLACMHYNPEPPAPWHLPPIVVLDSPISMSGRAQPHAGALPPAYLPSLGPHAGHLPLAAQATEGATTTFGPIRHLPAIARHRGTHIITKPSTRAPQRSKNRTNRSKSALAVNKTVATKQTTESKQKKQKMITAFFQPTHQVPSPSPHPLPPPPPQAPTPPPPKPKDPTLTLLQLNAQGSLWTMKEDLIHLKHLHSPDIIGICDIGLKGKNKRGKWLTNALQGYQYWAACHTNPEGRATHGVLLAVKDHIARLCNPTTSAIDTCQGRLLHITLRPPHSQPLGISEVYAPAGNTPENNSQRQLLYNLITRVTQTDSEAYGPTYQIHMGDWNATLFPSDRTSHTTYQKDIIHREYVMSDRLVSTDDTPPRAHTYHHPDSSSRIDDVYTNFKCEAQTYIADEGELTDHTPLLTSIHLKGTNLFIPQARPLPPPPPTKTIVRPIAQEDQAAFKQAIQSYTIGQASQIQSLHSELEQITTHTIVPFYASIDSHSGKASNRLQMIHGENAAAVIDRLSSKLLTIGSDAHTLMLETCKTKMTNPSGKHYDKRCVNKKRRKLNKCLQDFRQLHREMASEGVNTIEAANNLIDSKPDMSLETKNRWLSTKDANNESTTPSQRVADLMSAAKVDIRRDIKALDKDKSRTNLQQAIDHTRRLIDTRPKQANRIMRQGNQPQNKYPAFFDPTQKHCTDDPTRMNSIVTDYFTQALSAPPQGKTGRYLPSEIPRDYPWEKGTDKFQLETHATRLATRPQLHTRINDPTVFEECFRTLSNGKAPGPDGVENELLKIMPREYKECIHMLLKVMWATGITPDKWKESTTILLEKEGKDSTHVENNRPIGLLNTIYKLWTKLITRAIYDYAEQYGILSTSQKGFRKFSNTMDQLQMFIMALEDARLTGQNIYKIQVDFSKAFEMIDHDKMLSILYDLGLPTDAIDVIRDLYTGASTRVKWGATGITDPISQNRGTIQGDSLSPLLFTLTLEPLLRWLSTGGRGYMFGCLAEDPEAQLRNSTSGIAFADDLDILTNNLSNTKIQAEKLSRYSDWANMCVNQGKTEVSAMLYQDLATSPQQRGGRSHKRMYQQIKAQLHNQIMVQNKHIRFKDPREPFTYLGAVLTMTLDWKYQMQALVKKAHDRVSALMAAHASPRQIAHNIRTAIIPALANTIGITPCNKSDIHLLDSILTQAAKRGHGIPAFGPTAMTQEDRESGGLDIPSMMVPYAVKHSQLLIEFISETETTQ